MQRPTVTHQWESLFDSNGSSTLLQFRKRTKPLWNRQLLSKPLHKILETGFVQETWKLIFTCGDAWRCLCAWPLQALILVLICSTSHPYLCYWFLLFLQSKQTQKNRFTLYMYALTCILFSRSCFYITFCSCWSMWRKGLRLCDLAPECFYMSTQERLSLCRFQRTPAVPPSCSSDQWEKCWACHSWIQWRSLCR